ncbi:odorant receptor 131-2-like [Syngnathoides biaculeatus]|uniref:odorant receptor 131-2-like n=1 Tax=Syngnathoides biaculeatus TaxID=300417 RepID=UPI002ADE04BB|nr:odorant receptor 131-2-like [Syngnathoides biaculeatus]
MSVGGPTSRRPDMNATVPEDGWRKASLSKASAVFGLCLAVIAVNCALLYAYLRDRDFRTQARYVLYAHLLINDVMLLTGSMTMQVVTYSTRLAFIPCSVLILVFSSANKISPMNLAAMAVERYVAVCRPLHHARLCRVRRAHGAIALMWLVSLTAGLADIITAFATTAASALSAAVPVCYPPAVFNTPQHRTLSLVTQVLLFSGVSTAVVLTYYRVALAARAATGSDRASAQKARGTIGLHAVQLLVCLLSYVSPLVVARLAAIYPSESLKMIYASFLLVNVLPRMLSSLVYGVRDKKFNAGLRVHFCCERGGRRRHGRKVRLAVAVVVKNN